MSVCKEVVAECPDQIIDAGSNDSALDSSGLMPSAIGELFPWDITSFEVGSTFAVPSANTTCVFPARRGDLEDDDASDAAAAANQWRRGGNAVDGTFIGLGLRIVRIGDNDSCALWRQLLAKYCGHPFGTMCTAMCSAQRKPASKFERRASHPLGNVSSTIGVAILFFSGFGTFPS